MADICVLCASDVSEGSAKVKRRKLFGLSTKNTKMRLDEWSMEKHGVNISEMLDKDSYICASCISSIEKVESIIEKARVKAEAKKNEIVKKIEFLLGIQDGSRSQDIATPAIDQWPTNNSPSRDDNVDQLQEDLHVQATSTPPSKRQRTNIADLSVEVKVGYQSGDKTTDVASPWAKQNIGRITRGSYRALSTSMVESSRTSENVIVGLANKIRHEVKDICSRKHDSILRDDNEGVQLANNPQESKPLLCLIALMLLKNRLRNMCLVQRAISVLLYGNGTSKQIYNCLQPLGVCLSHTGTLALIERLSQDHDIKVQLWSDDLLTNLKERQAQSISLPTQRQPLDVYITQAGATCEDDDDNDGEDDDNDDDSDNDYDDGDDDACDCDYGVSDDECVDDASSSVHIDEVAEIESMDMIATCSTNTESLQACITNEENEKWMGFRLVGDNVDKNVRRSFQRVGYTTQSFHYFHSYAVLDRVDLSGVSDLPKDGVINTGLLLPSENDIVLVKEIMVTLVSRILVESVDEYHGKHADVTWHIRSKYEKEMKQVSHVVPLGVLLFNENKIDEMCQIIDRLQKFVPTTSSIESIPLPDGQVHRHEKVEMHKILLGGDQVTCARVRGAQAVRGAHDNAKDALKGVVPVSEDWHTRLTLMKTLWHCLYVKSTEKGTLRQIKNLINRSSVPNNPEKNMKAAEDFLDLVLKAHVIVGTRQLLNQHQCQAAAGSIKEIATMFVDTFVRVSSGDKSTKDEVFLYACDVVTLGLMWKAYYDACKEGDGERIMLMYKFLMIIFKLTRHKNYAKETLITLHNYHFLLSDRKAAQLAHSRTINTQGMVGKNIPGDLFMEHLNRRLKVILKHLGSNVQPPTIVKAAKSIGVVHSICEIFQNSVSSSKTSIANRHSKPSANKDLKLILTTLEEMEVFDEKPSRKHTAFSYPHHLLEKYNKDNILDWAAEKILNYLTESK